MSSWLAGTLICFAFIACGRGEKDPIPDLAPAYAGLKLGMAISDAKRAAVALGAPVQTPAYSDSGSTWYMTLCQSPEAGARTQAERLRIAFIADPRTEKVQAVMITEPTSQAEALKWINTKGEEFGLAQEVSPNRRRWFVNDWSLELSISGSGRTIAFGDTAIEGRLHSEERR